MCLSVKACFAQLINLTKIKATLKVVRAINQFLLCAHVYVHSIQRIHSPKPTSTRTDECKHLKSCNHKQILVQGNRITRNTVIKSCQVKYFIINGTQQYYRRNTISPSFTRYYQVTPTRSNYRITLWRQGPKYRITSWQLNYRQQLITDWRNYIIQHIKTSPL